MTNRKSLEVRINKQELDESGRAEEVLLHLSDLLDIPVEDLTTALDSKQYFDFQPKPVAEFVDEDVRFYIEEHQNMFPGVDVVDASVRSYPYGRMAAHIVGTLSQINGDEVDDPAFEDYGLNDLVGRSGLEATYEKWLRGKKGKQNYVVNADGETIRQLGGKEPDRREQPDPVPGLRGAGGCGDRPSTTASPEPGRCSTTAPGSTSKRMRARSWCSTPRPAASSRWRRRPSYDPRWFVRGLKPDEACYLGLAAEWKCGGADSMAPLLDRAYQEVYIPGSTFKPFTALSAVQEGYATLGGSYGCPPTYIHGDDESGTEFTNWSPVDLGYMPISELLRISCDTAFYKWGSDFYYRYVNEQFGDNNEPLQRDLRQWGFQSRTGIDLPGEAEGLIPDAAWGNDPAQEPIFGQYGWPPGGDILLMIGSGYVTVTPLQLAQAYATLANDGHMCRPHLVDHIENAEGKVVKTINGQCDRTVPYSQAQLDYIMNALTQVPVQRYGEQRLLRVPA